MREWGRLALICALAAGAGIGSASLFSSEPIAPAPAAPDDATPAAPDDADRPICPTRVMSVPAGAMIYRDEVLLGASPLELERPCEKSWQLRLTLPGYLEIGITLDERSPSAVQPRPFVLEKMKL